MTSNASLEELQRQLNYQFTDLSLLKQALTHRSKSKKNFERLEFLGDSLIGFVVSDLLYEHFPDQPEGILTRLRSNVVKQLALAIVARRLRLSDHLMLGPGEGKSGGQHRDSTLSDCLEAIIAAIFLDGGIDQARLFIEAAFLDQICALDPYEQLKDPKSILQEWLQQHKYELPDYQVSKITGQEHNQTFVVECRTPMGSRVFLGKGSTRRIAEQKAASKVLEFITRKIE